MSAGKGRFRVYSHGYFIGWSDLEHQDRVMGTAYGEFRPDGEYDDVRKFVWEANDSRDLAVMGALALTVRDLAERVLPASEGVWISDRDDPIALREVQLLGFRAFDEFLGTPDGS